ncbi:isoleucine--tRNA ligase [Mollicutes bacterium LVI A0078]|nr:isoleucine--tRNA ligase [Mollicutes bacterium LVI A0075]WOO90840.1 isoleucine--tRNA ligase [Mollicutes bacterium LVI A0078]
MNIKETLFTPKTSFAMKANLSNREPQMQKAWIENDIYSRRRKLNEGKPLFVLLDGPPYANGDIHVGHAMNKILKDFNWRYKSMTGFDVPVTLGWDTHGLPIENALLKKGKIKRHELTDNEFRDLCEEYAKKQVANQKEQFMSLGLLADGTETYQTFEKDYEAEQIRVFAKMIERGMIYKGLKPVYWSPTSQSALAEAEVEYQDKRSPAIYVGFDIIVNDDFADTQAVIWTTTPWTIPANMGISVGADFDYSQIEMDGKKYLIATDLVSSFAKEFEMEATILKTVRGSELEYIKVKHPLFDRTSFIMLADHVTVDAGTGCVHTAPGHGEDDFIVGKKYDLEVVSVVDYKGTMTEAAGEYAGEFYDNANKAICEKLDENGNLLKLTFITHSYPHDWRTKKPIIFRATAQWFASIDKVKAELMNEINNEISWVNEWGQVRLGNMIKDRVDWCISRQRKWGVPIPIIYTEDETPIFDKEVLEHIATLFEEHGSNIWFEKEAKDLLPAGYTHELSPNGEFTKETDIMDVWFDSGVGHSAVAKNRLGKYQSDLFLEGSDQYRGWFNSSLITGVIAEGKAPYKRVVSHGFVMDAKGNKMSKSLGNTVAPKKIVNQNGADILRLWVASVDYQADARIGDEIIKQVSETYRKYRNAIRFGLGNLHYYEGQTYELAELPIVDQYILTRLNEIVVSANQAFEDLEFKTVVELVNNFITNELSAFYFDFIKDITYISSIKDERRRQIEFVVSKIMEALLLVMSPILPHTTNEGWQALTGDEEQFIFLQEIPTNLGYDADLTEINWFRSIQTEINKALEEARNEKTIGKSLEAKVTLNVTDEDKQRLDNISEKELMLIVSKLVITGGNEGLSVDIEKYTEHRCERCWKYFEQEELSDDSICPTCADVIAELN